MSRASSGASGKRTVVLGATRGMGRALARQLAERGDRLFLLGRDERELARASADLGVRGGAPVAYARCDLEDPASFEGALRRALLAGGGGTLCVFSSVAGDRGRSPVVLYGAAKAGLSAYLEGLDHRHHRDGLRVVCVKPGFVRTGMTEGLPAPPFAGEAEEVARRVVRAIDRGSPVVYAPLAWGPVMRIVRALPRFVMRRVAF